MSRYVDIEPYDNCKIVLHGEDNGIPCRALPTADVAPVEHGVWRPAKDDPHRRRYCSVCGMYSKPYYAYCPHCGAEMQGGYVIYGESIMRKHSV